MTPYLEQTFRWFGPADPIPLAHIRQAGATGVVTALHHITVGQLWTPEEIAKQKAFIEAAVMRWSVVESVPVHEDIKRWRGDVEMYLDRYCQSLRNLAAAGIKTVCYNFMAITDWTRTDVDFLMPDGSEALRFDAIEAAAFDVLVLKRPGAEKGYAPDVLQTAEERWSKTPPERQRKIIRTILMGLPGTVEDLTVEQFRDRLGDYADIDSDTLREHHTRFLKCVVPVAEELGMRLAIHPDDPPFAMFGLPRIAGDEAGLKRIIEAVDSPANGITFCTGSLGAKATNDPPGILKRLGHRVHFLHLPNVKPEADRSFFEDDHLAGSTDMAAVMSEAIDLMARRGESLPMRPDHGHRMLGDLQQSGFYAGYSAIGRVRGLAELRGLEMGLRRGRQLS